MQNDRHFWVHLMDVPEPQSESWGVTGIHKFSPICGAWKAARLFSLGKITATQSCGTGTAGPVLSVLQGRRCCCAGWKWHSPVRRELWENFLWLPGLLWNCHGHWDTLHCVVGITAFCLGNEKGCPLPAVWIGSKCSLRKCGERKKIQSLCKCKWIFFLYSLSLGEKGVNELAHLLRDCSHISSQKILVSDEMHVRNILLSVACVAKIFF